MAETKAFIFKPMKRHSTLFGCGAKEWAITVLIAALGALLAFSLGFVKQPTEVDYNYAERLSMYDNLDDIREAEQLVESFEKHGEIEETTEVRNAKELLSKNENTEVKSTMTDDDLWALIPKTHYVDMPTIADVPRWMIFFFAPTVIAFALQMEMMHNSSVYKELKRIIRNARAQHVYFSKPREYMERYELSTRRAK